jgi:excinuclease UvrABC nuclease subunit
MKPVKSVWFYPYVVKNNKLKPNLRLGSKKFNTGVYFIKNAETNEIVYIGFSQSNLHRTLYRHFQVWNDEALQKAGKNRIVLNKRNHKVKIIFCSGSKALKFEKILIQRYKPKFNKLQYDLDFELNKNKPAYIEAQEDLKDIVTARPGEDENDLPF